MKFFSALVVGLALISGSAFANPEEQSPRVLVHLLDYIGLDYPGAIQNGKIIEKFEYNEQIEFANTLIELNKKLPETNSVAGIATDLENLKRLILAKADPAEVAKAAKDVKWKIVGVSGMQLAPATWPNLKHGKEVYDKNCAQCHGVTGHGDGPSGKSIDPKPTDFHEGDKMAKLPPFQAYNAIRLGVPGTGMASWSTLSDEDIWSLAFYVVSFRHGSIDDQTAFALPTGLNLQKVTTMSDEELVKILPGDNDAARATALASLRRYAGGTADANSFLKLARTELEGALAAYQQGQFDESKKRALMAYLNGVEPIEPRIRASDTGLLADIETAMGNVRTAIDNRLPVTELQSRVAAANVQIDRAEALLKQRSSPLVTFMVSSGIVLREAFEAILLIITLLGVIRSVGSARAALFVHGGWILACAIGIVLWFMSGWVMQISGADREVLEGSVALIAVVVVLYMGFWLHRKTEIGRWRSFLDELVKSAVSTKSLILLAGIAFMAVFREAFETVLFLRAVLLESGGAHHSAMLSGVVVSLAAVLVLAYAAVKFSARIPIRQLFEASSAIMIVLSVILLGKAVHSFQEAGYLSISAFPVNFRWDFLGIYPSWESLLPQLFLVIVSAVVWVVGKRPQMQEARV